MQMIKRTRMYARRRWNIAQVSTDAAELDGLVHDQDAIGLLHRRDDRRGVQRLFTSGAELATRLTEQGPAGIQPVLQVIEPGTRRQDCGQVTDGGCAVVLASARFAQVHAQRQGKALADLARLSGWGHRNGGLRLLDKFSRSEGQTYMFPHLRQALEDAWQRAGVPGVQAMDGIETHDCFTTTEYVAIDHLGLTPPGQSWQAVESGVIEPGGACPVNMSGGLIGCGHPVGATGSRMLLDAARRVTHQAEDCQIEGASRVQTLNIGGSFATVVSFVVERG